MYGNAFARADADTVRRATTRIEPPTITNLIAMAASPGGYGRYSVSEIETVLATAFTGFRAVLESMRQRDVTCPFRVHTGFWGCGAFGGHRVLMATLQILAAEMAGLERLVFHTFDAPGTKAPDAARVLIEGTLASGSVIDTGELIRRVAAMGFEWGVSDGN